MTDGANAKQVVEELLLALPSSDSAIKEEMVVKIAILAEQFAVDFRWYLDTTVQVRQLVWRSDILLLSLMLLLF